MIKKNERMTSRDFHFIKKSKFFKKSIEGKFVYITLYFCELDKKYAVVLSKKKFKKATERNFIRRRYYHIIRKNYPQDLHFCYFVLFPKKSALFASFQELKEDFIRIIHTLSFQ